MLFGTGGVEVGGVIGSVDIISWLFPSDSVGILRVRWSYLPGPMLVGSGS